MAKINILDSTVYNQISAGEVVENPASIVKELIENSIDAGAQNITVMIEDGGIKSVQLIDDGEGMEESDLYRSILPHATSKISIADDLATISTLGFRGEALASISAVSQIEIKSKHINAEFAYGITVKGGEIIEKGVVPLNKGTSITVTNLFYNTPARYKFLKSKNNEENQVTELMQNMIVSNPTIAIRYYIDKKLVYSSAGENLKSAIESIYNTSIIENLLEVDYINTPYKITGFIAKPSSCAIKSNRSYQTIIINGRIVKDFSLSSVVHNAYGEALMKRTFPLFVFDIIMPFDMVDVNVHPNKKEVRFSVDCKINGAIYKAVKNTIEKCFEKSLEEISFIKQSPQKSENDLIADLFDFDTNKPTLNNEKADELTQKLSYLSSTSPKVFDGGVHKLKEATDFSHKIITQVQELPYKLVGQAFDTYIIIEYNENLYLIDQHAAHERIIFDNYLKMLAKKPIDVQDLMIPFLYQAENVDLILSQAPILEEMGFAIEDFGNNIIKVNSIPLIFLDMDIDIFLNDLKEVLTSVKDINDIEILKDKIAKKACKSAIKGGTTLANEDIQYALDVFAKNNIPLQCPHGRPVIVKISKKDLEKMFRRIV